MTSKQNKLILYLASSNKNKLKEIKNILKELKIKNLELKNAPQGFEVNENGKSFLENAFKKASTLSKQKKAIAFADDSGIEVSCMNGKPGIKSARFFKNGKGLEMIVKKASQTKNKKCNFTCALVVTDKNGKTLFKVQKKWHGQVADTAKGKNGFGYDPIFIVPKLNKTSAELTSKEKDKLSHRGQAVKEFGKWLKQHTAISEQL